MLGPVAQECEKFVSAVCKNTKVHTLDLSKNDIGTASLCVGTAVSTLICRT